MEVIPVFVVCRGWYIKKPSCGLPHHQQWSRSLSQLHTSAHHSSPSSLLPGGGGGGGMEGEGRGGRGRRGRCHAGQHSPGLWLPPGNSSSQEGESQDTGHTINIPSSTHLVTSHSEVKVLPTILSLKTNLLTLILVVYRTF